ncbi:Uncharacterized protein ChrSV_1812 [Chromobacterium vaccinii]|nr:Uncharacterized protein ChrSW_1812 [Chromobacterium vaccinii]QND89270.1 Uncharacterized protein ChrSV_1812 [Chromobacterium vaccinii]
MRLSIYPQQSRNNLVDKLRGKPVATAFDSACPKKWQEA